MYSKVAAVFIKVYNDVVGDFEETSLFKSAKDGNEEEVNAVIEDRTPSNLFEEHGKLINWIYGIYKWDGDDKLNEEQLFMTDDDEEEMKKPTKVMNAEQYQDFMASLALIYKNKRELEEARRLLKKGLTVRDLYLHVRFIYGHSLIEAIKAQNELEKRTTELEAAKTEAIAEATKEANERADAKIAEIQADANAKIAKVNEDMEKTVKESQEGLKMAAERNQLFEDCQALETKLSDAKSVIEKYKSAFSQLKRKGISKITTEDFEKLQKIYDTKDLRQMLQEFMAIGF